MLRRLKIAMAVLLFSVASAHAAYHITPYAAERYTGLAQGRDGQPITLRPTEIYGTAPDIGIRLGNGGAGQIGLFRALAEAYLKTDPRMNGKPFAIAWYSLGAYDNLQALKHHVIDVAFAYRHTEVEAALNGGNAYGRNKRDIFKDYWILVGPNNNPAKVQPTDTVSDALGKIKAAGCVNVLDGTRCAVFDSRNDNSATNDRELKLWSRYLPANDLMQQLWYFTKHATPTQALQRASANHFYALNDHSTWVSNPDKHDSLVNYIDGSQNNDPELYNPCFAILAQPQYLPSDAAEKFVAWLLTPQAQKIIATYTPIAGGAPVLQPIAP